MSEKGDRDREEPTDLLAVYQEQLPEAIEEKMAVGERRWGASWEDSHPDYMIRRMEEEFYEFRQQLEHKNGEIAAVEEMADMVNYGLMALALTRCQGAAGEQEGQ